MIQLTHDRTLVSLTDAERERLRADFAANAYIKAPAFLHPQLRDALMQRLDRTDFYHRVHEGIGTEVCASSGAVSAVLEFLMNDPALHAEIRRLTGCGEIGCFEGRVYRLSPKEGHYDSWHSDVGEGRLVGVSINVSHEPYEGGVLEFRHVDSDTIMAAVENRTVGDAVIFRIDPSLRHRVGPLLGTASRTAYAGWFRSSPDFRALMRERLSHHSAR
ncbi:MAG: 2OG-Fe(II) oxygenase [Acidobacteriaceae bacterium]|jgi:hypothetical protein|nr:2OG-Fe(II) oxygenase [Acidobacteriaceae bacterium]